MIYQGDNQFRHTSQQKQLLEEFFQNCSHPNKKQWQQLSEKLGLEPKQIKFWFQNRRTQKKMQDERAETDALKLENEKLLQENLNMQEALKNLVCPTCDYRPLIDERHQSDILKLRTENVKLKLELERVSKVVENIKGKKVIETPSFSDTIPILGKPIPEIHSLWPSLDVETEGGAIFWNISNMMVKSFWENLYMCQKTHFPHVENDDIRVYVRQSNMPGHLVFSASSTSWLGVSREALFNFLVDEKSRVQWDIFTDQSSMKTTTDTSFGSHPGIRVSILQPSNLSESSMFILQQSYNDPLGSVIIYAPIPVKRIRSMISGEDSDLPILPVGFTISGNAHAENPGDVACTSSSSRIGGGSILTMFFQNFSGTVSSPINTIIISTMQKIKAALNC